MDGDINKYNFKNIYNELYQHLEDTPNSVNQYFPNDQCKLQSKTQVKNSFIVQEKPMDFNVREHEKVTGNGFMYHIVSNFKETNIC